MRSDAFHHPHFHALGGPPLHLDIVHEAANEEDATAARLQEIFGRERVGDLLGIEALAFVLDPDDEFRRILCGHVREFDGDPFFDVVLVAVLDGVDDGFANRHADPMQRIVIEPGQATDVVADDLDEIQHVKCASELDTNRMRRRHAALRRASVSALSIGAP